MDKLQINCKRCEKDNFSSMETLQSYNQHFCKECGALILSYMWEDFKDKN